MPNGFLLSGKTFGRLVVQHYAGLNKHGCRLWRCRCSCRTWITTTSSNLVSGVTKSCGCFQKDQVRNSRFRHGESSGVHKTKEYSAWESMHRRCESRNTKFYKYYGGRGIRVCKRWSGKKGYVFFLHDMGRAPSSKYSLDRRNVDHGYKPSNCRWATFRQQIQNRGKVEASGV